MSSRFVVAAESVDKLKILQFLLKLWFLLLLLMVVVVSVLLAFTSDCCLLLSPV